jgi:hypothetical protein
LEPFVADTMRDTANLLTAVARPQTGIPWTPGISVHQKLANPTREWMPIHPAISPNAKYGGRIIWFLNSNGKILEFKRSPGLFRCFPKALGDAFYNHIDHINQDLLGSLIHAAKNEYLERLGSSIPYQERPKAQPSAIFNLLSSVIQSHRNPS